MPAKVLKGQRVLFCTFCRRNPQCTQLVDRPPHCLHVISHLHTFLNGQTFSKSGPQYVLLIKYNAVLEIFGVGKKFNLDRHCPPMPPCDVGATSHPLCVLYVWLPFYISYKCFQLLTIFKCLNARVASECWKTEHEANAQRGLPEHTCNQWNPGICIHEMFHFHENKQVSVM